MTFLQRGGGDRTPPAQRWGGGRGSSVWGGEKAKPPPDRLRSKKITTEPSPETLRARWEHRANEITRSDPFYPTPHSHFPMSPRHFPVSLSTTSGPGRVAQPRPQRAGSPHRPRRAGRARWPRRPGGAWPAPPPRAAAGSRKRPGRWAGRREAAGAWGCGAGQGGLGGGRGGPGRSAVGCAGREPSPPSRWCRGEAAAAGRGGCGSRSGGGAFAGAAGSRAAAAVRPEGAAGPAVQRLEGTRRGRPVASAACPGPGPCPGLGDFYPRECDSGSGVAFVAVGVVKVSRPAVGMSPGAVPARSPPREGRGPPLLSRSCSSRQAESSTCITGWTVRE